VDGLPITVFVGFWSCKVYFRVGGRRTSNGGSGGGGGGLQFGVRRTAVHGPLCEML
jgi:hypothetical protein